VQRYITIAAAVGTTYYSAIEKKKNQISRDYYGAVGSPSLSVVVGK
jgi:hypothetical protein